MQKENRIMGFGSFSNEATNESNPKWRNSIERESKLYLRENDPRSEFNRDYNRILHCTAYRRLKRKTQVFFATENDHICTRIEHVNHVVSVSHTISSALGLNTQLTSAIAIGHDLGHAPFGHEGEKILKDIAANKIGDAFWHEKNSLHFVDDLETLPDPNNRQCNLSLTYAVRDGIISHCGKVDDNYIKPRKEAIDLKEIKKPNEYLPYTWEACVVKIADKIAFLGRDIEDAFTLKLLSLSKLRQLNQIIKDTAKVKLSEINNTVLMHDFILDLIESSSPDSGIMFSTKYMELILKIKKFNYENIYMNPHLNYFKRYARVMVESIFKILSSFDHSTNLLSQLEPYKLRYPLLIETFYDWIIKYTDIDIEEKESKKYYNKIVYKINDRKDYLRAIIDFISGMTDSFAIKVFREITTF